MASERITLTVLVDPTATAWSVYRVRTACCARGRHHEARALRRVRHRGGRSAPPRTWNYRSARALPGLIDCESFFSKNPPKGTSDYALRRGHRPIQQRPPHPQLVLTEPAATVFGAIQMNTIVFHPWASLAGDTDNSRRACASTWIRSRAPTSWIRRAVPAAHALREVLGEAGLEAWVKTSGNRGLHVPAPDRPTCIVFDVCHAVRRRRASFERRMPDKVSDELVEGGARRAYLRRLQPGEPRPQQMAGAYSPRALGRRAAVSTPVTSGFDEVDPAAFTVRSIPERLAARSAIRGPASSTGPGGIDTLLEWWQRDLDAALGELLPPARFPQDAGEPPRVQPRRRIPRRPTEDAPRADRRARHPFCVPRRGTSKPRHGRGDEPRAWRTGRERTSRRVGDQSRTAPTS